MKNLTAVDQSATVISLDKPLKVQSVAFASLPTAGSAYAGCIIYSPDGNAGSPGLLFCNGTNWVNVDDLATSSGS